MLLNNGLIGLREGLEAALVVSILVAFLVKTDRKHALKWVWAGVGTAVALSVGFGALITFTAANMTFEQQELFGGVMSIIAVAFVTGMIFWMRATARTIAADLRGKLDEALNIGPLAVITVSFLSVGREGLETAVFFYSSVQSAGGGTTEPLIGFLAGIAVSIVLAWLLYAGAVRFNLTKFFTITGALLVFVAAGVLSYGIHDLQEAAFLPGLHSLAFDVTDTIPESSWYGALLKGIFNYSQQTSWLQAIAWVTYVAIVLPLFLIRPRTRVAATN
ncbi:iron transporter [Lentzea sp. NBRC 105346]|uniref:iron uptake transporter permease EfeU n=1 Tax=Lentzea sp. NBRC 105346 TaxID=3032205 RepID=UPI0024A06F5E|nr:iron uptake transporter permease EfeU [Lentzea sp. NBRC 105346]GLZ34522.1 iron transporter [Lentzea sp. NBRC 105346]